MGHKATARQVDDDKSWRLPLIREAVERWRAKQERKKQIQALALLCLKRRTKTGRKRRKRNTSEASMGSEAQI